MENLLEVEKNTNAAEKCKCVIRLKTFIWHDKNGLYFKKNMTYLKRKSFGYNILHEDCYNINVTEVYEKIVNIFEVPDGIYEVITCDEILNTENNSIEDYGYKLIPVIE